MAQRRYVVDNLCAGLQRRFHHGGAAGVDADRCAHRCAIFDGWDYAFQFVPFPRRGGTGPGAFPANVDQCGACFEHGRGMRAARFRIVEEIAPIGETVRRYVENSQQLRLIELDGSLAQLQSRMGEPQRSPLRLSLRRHAIG